MSIVMDLSDSDDSDPLSAPDSQDSLVPHPNEEAFLSTTSLVCRPKPAQVWLLPLGALETAFILGAPFIPDKQNPESNLLALAFIAVPFGLLMATGLVWLGFDWWRGEIRATDKGLTWRRGWGTSKSALWNEVTDFYRKYPTGARIVETHSGKLELPTSFQGTEDVAEFVAQRVPQAPTGTWMIRSSKKGGKWSLSLTYWTKSQQLSAPIFTLVILSVVVAALYGAFDSLQRGRSIDWLSILPVSPLILTYGALIGWVIPTMWRGRRLAWEHRGEELDLNSQGLWFHSEKKQIQAKWSEIRSVSRVEGQKPLQAQVMPVQFRVETNKGDFFLWHLSEGQVWNRFRYTLKQYAPHALENLEREEREAWKRREDIDGERGAWSDGAVGAGARQWSYRSSGTRFMLQIVSFLGGLIPFLYLLISYSASLSDIDVPYSPPWATFIGLWIMSALAISAGGLWYRRAAILAHEEGLEIRSPFHTPHRLAWADIDEVDTDSFGDFVRARGRKFYLSLPISPVRYEELMGLLHAKTGRGKALQS